MQDEHTFVKGNESTAYGLKKDSCLKCGRTEESHLPVEPEVHIYFQGKLYKFINWRHARNHGFWI